MKYIKNLNKQSTRKLQNFSTKNTLENILIRGVQDYSEVLKIVKDIEKSILEKGDEYSKKLTKKFDGADLEKFKVSKEEIEKAQKLVSVELKKAIILAKNNIEKFHQRQIPNNLEPEETCLGVLCSKQFRAIEKVGLYIPGGTAPLFSTVLMLAIPAVLAGCTQIAICTPPQKDGTIAPEILYTAELIGIKNIYKIGGAQAIFSLAYGTQQIPKVDKIFGPGNSFVTAAKMLVSSKVAIDMPAGPSEVLVIADKEANAEFVAADLLSQAEHGTDSQVVLLSDSKEKTEEVLELLDTQLDLPQPLLSKEGSRKDICKKALENSFIILVEDINEAIKISNQYAPEHLILQVQDYEKYIPKIINAGSVFLGKYSCESAGDYASGTNHTLPTSGYAKSYSGVSVESFGKWITFQELSKKGIESIGEAVEVMAEAEGLQAHKNAMSVRRKEKYFI